MKQFKVTYQRENGTIDFEVVLAKNEKSAEKKMSRYCYHINAEILSTEAV